MSDVKNNKNFAPTILGSNGAVLRESDIGCLYLVKPKSHGTRRRNHHSQQIEMKRDMDDKTGEELLNSNLYWRNFRSEYDQDAQRFKTKHVVANCNTSAKDASRRSRNRFNGVG